MSTVEILRVEFRSDLFDITGEPPEEAINGQYGRAHGEQAESLVAWKAFLTAEEREFRQRNGVPHR